ncbi:MAG: sterol desaturase family protein, partial [Pseudomonadota bacterium]
MPSFPDPTLVAIPAFIFFVALEWWAVAQKRATGRYEVKDAFASMTMGLGSSISGALFGYLAYTVTLWVWESARLTDIALTAWTLAGLMVLNDFLYYWKHRAMHRVRWFWANHIVHHSSEHYNLTTALRQPWTGPITGLFVIGLPQVILGFHPAAVAFAGGINLLYQFWIHTEAIDRTPRWFEAIFNTPSHHRVHHARNPRY